jgi:hypothetical protein
MKPSTDETSEIREDGLRARRLGLVREAAQPLWESAAVPNGVVTTDTLLHASGVPSATLPEDVEQRIIDAVMRPHVGECCAEISARRERELLAIFVKLTPARAWQLRKRLDDDRGDDRIVVAFRRLIVGRRQRLYAALVGHRR